MKKFLFLILSIGLFSSAQAQFGLRAGLSSTNFSDTNFEEKAGFHAGVYYRKDLGFLSLEPGVQYSQKGYKSSLVGSNAEVKERLDYIDVPILLRANFFPFLNVFAGPQASILASRKYEIGSSIDTSTEPVRGYDIGGVVGVGANLPLNLNVQLSYDFGLTSLNYFNSDVKNRVLKLSLGIDL